MNWDAIGAVAELTGALGVILSLAYPAYQIRLNSKQIKQNAAFIESSVYQSVNDAILSWHGIIAQNPDVAMIWKKFARDWSSKKKSAHKPGASPQCSL